MLTKFYSLYLSKFWSPRRVILKLRQSLVPPDPAFLGRNILFPVVLLTMFSDPEIRMCIWIFEIRTSPTSGPVCRSGLWGLIPKFVVVLMQIQNSFFFLDKNICPIFRAFWDLLSLSILPSTILAPCNSAPSSMCVWVFYATKHSDTSCVSYNITQFWLYLAGDSIRSHRLRSQYPHLKLQMLCFWPAFSDPAPRVLLIG